MMLASFLPFIFWRAFLHHDELPPWISIAQLLGLGVILGLVLISPSLRPLLGVVMALIAFVVGDWIRYALERTPGVMDWTKTAPQYQWIFVDSLFALVPGLLMAATLIGSGMKRQGVFLTKGDLSAPSKMPFGIRSIPWTWLGPILIVVFSIPLVMQLSAALGPDFSLTKKVVAALPIIVAFAIVNAASEEFRFRCVLLARIEPVLGRGQALGLTSTLFGLGHWFGHPSGLSGVVMAGIAGWLWGKSMIETRGLFWAWLIHGIQDVIILVLVVITTT